MSLKLICLSTFCFLAASNCKAQLTYQPDLINREYLGLYSSEDDTVQTNYKIEKIYLVGSTCSTFLGSYDDWTKTRKYVWVRFRNELDKEFQNYLNSVSVYNDNSINVELAIHKFQHKQYLLFNPKGCFYRYKYELYYYQNDQKYSYIFEDEVKIKNVKNSSQILEQIKLSITQLLNRADLTDIQ